MRLKNKCIDLMELSVIVSLRRLLFDAKAQRHKGTPYFAPAIRSFPTSLNLEGSSGGIM
jgi:hypothetical protein